MDWFMLMMLTVATVVGLGLLYLDWSLWRQVKASRQWPATEGSVTATAVAEVTVTRRKTRIEMHEARVAYRYTVEGRDCNFDRIGWTPYHFADPALARQFLAGFPVGSKVTVYYDPQRPTRAVLQPETEPEAGELNPTGLGCLIGVLLVAVPLYLWPWLTHQALLASAPPPGETLAERPAQELLLTTNPFPPDWVVNECQACDVFNLSPDRAMRQFRITDMRTGVTESVYRYASAEEARDRFLNARQNMAREMPLGSDVRYQSAVAAEQMAGCGLNYGEYTCLTLSRFGQYIVGLTYRPGGSNPGLKAADVENLLRALDSLAMERLGARSM